MACPPGNSTASRWRTERAKRWWRCITAILIGVAFVASFVTRLADFRTLNVCRPIHWFELADRVLAAMRSNGRHGTLAQEGMRRKLTSTVWLLLWTNSTPLIPAQDQGRGGNRLCNRDGTLCVNTAVLQSVVQNPFYFEVDVRCPTQIELSWELRDNSGKLLDQDPEGRLAFLVSKQSASERTLAVRDFSLAPATTSRGKLLLHAAAYSIAGVKQPLPELSIPLHLDTRTTVVTYAVPADSSGFSQAVTNSVESDPPHRVAMQAEVDWRTTTLLYVQPAMLGGAAAEAAARTYPGQGPWHLVNYSKALHTAHLTIYGDGWAGVTYYLAGLDFLLDKTVEHLPGVRRVMHDMPPDFGQ
jgi:hypothetical protein